MFPPDWETIEKLSDFLLWIRNNLCNMTPTFPDSLYTIWPLPKFCLSSLLYTPAILPTLFCEHTKLTLSSLHILWQALLGKCFQHLPITFTYSRLLHLPQTPSLTIPPNSYITPATNPLPTLLSSKLHSTKHYLNIYSSLVSLFILSSQLEFKLCKGREFV